MVMLNRKTTSQVRVTWKRKKKVRSQHYKIKIFFVWVLSVVEWIEHLLLKRKTWFRFPVGSNQKLGKLVFVTAFLLDV